MTGEKIIPNQEHIPGANNERVTLLSLEDNRLGTCGVETGRR